MLSRICINSKKFSHVVVSLSDDGKYAGILRSNGVLVYTLGLNPARPSVGKFVQLIRIIRDVSPDLVQTWMYHADLLGGCAARLAGVRHVFWGIRHTSLEKNTSKRATRVVAYLCGKLSRTVPERIVCCANTAAMVHEQCGYDGSRMVVVPNGYDLDHFKPDVDLGMRFRQSLGVSDTDVLIGMVGRYAPQKDHGNLISAVALLRDAGVKFKCLMIGSGVTGENRELASRIEREKLGDVVMLLGQRTDIPATMNALDIHVLSSISGEAFPNVVAEAMACGTPCVVTDVGDAAQIVDSVGVVVPAGDSVKLCQAIQTMLARLSDKESSKRLSDACSARIQDHYSLSAMVDSFESLWNQSVGGESGV